MIQTLSQTSQHAVDGFKHGATEASRAMESFFNLSQVIVNVAQGNVIRVIIVVVFIVFRHCL
jgi:hypothetical protein